MIFLAAALVGLGGTYAVWRWLRGGQTPLLRVRGMERVALYADLVMLARLSLARARAVPHPVH